MQDRVPFLYHIAKEVDLNEGPEGVLQVIRQIFIRGPISSKKLAQVTFLPIPITVAIRNELISRGFVSKTTKGAILTPIGLEMAKKELNLSLKIEPTCTMCDGCGLTISDQFEEKIEIFKEICSQRSVPKIQLNQVQSTPKTSILRIIQMIADGNLDGRRICFLGDNDLTSIVASLFGTPTTIKVLDIDKKLLNFIDKICTEYDFEISTVEQDLTTQVPHHLISQFDVFSTDPPYTLEGVKLFLHRGLEVLEKRSGCWGYISLRLSKLEEVLSIQNYIGKNGGILKHIFNNFNEYEGAEILGNRSDLFAFETTNEFSKIDIKSDTIPNDLLIYTGLKQQTIRYYKCTSCGEIHVVGKDQSYNTIESLKRIGCHQKGCQNKKFRLLERKVIT